MTQLFTVPTAPTTISELARQYATLLGVAALTNKNSDRIKARTAELDLDIALGIGNKQARCSSRTVVCYRLDQFNFLLSHREDRTTASWDSEMGIGIVRFKTKTGAQRALDAMALTTPTPEVGPNARSHPSEQGLRSATEELARIDSDEEHSGSRKVTPADGQTCARCGHRFDEHGDDGCHGSKPCPCAVFGP